MNLAQLVQSQNFATLLQALDAAGEPDPTDLHRCWAAGARTVRLVPR